MASQVVQTLRAAHLPPQAAQKAAAGFVQALSYASQGGFHLGRGESGGSVPIPHTIPPAAARQLTNLGRDIFRHSYLNAMKPSLALPICVLVLGAIVTTLMRTSPRDVDRRARPEMEQPGIAAAGE